MIEFDSSFIEIFTFIIVYIGSIFPVNIFIPSESLIILSGLKAATGGGWSLIIIVYFAIFLGDQSSYWLGRITGNRLTKKLKNRKIRRIFARGRLLIKKHGALFVFASRFLGPVALISDVSAGVYKLNYARYLVASTCGSFCAVSGFIGFGYLTGKGIIAFGFADIWLIVETFLEQNWLALLFGFCAITIITLLIKKFSSSKLEIS